MSEELSEMRREYDSPPLAESDVATEPIAQFRRWLAEAADVIPEANAMVLGTVSASGGVSQRTVLLKHVDETGFAFYTNYRSRKAAEIAANPRVSLLFGWFVMHRQVAVAGVAHPVPIAESAGYFATRPRGSQLAAWASAQSQPLSDRGELEAEFDRVAGRYPGEVPLPPHWGGYRVAPNRVEFWQGRTDRLHDRLVFSRDATGAWRMRRLAP